MSFGSDQCPKCGKSYSNHGVCRPSLATHPDDLDVVPGGCNLRPRSPNESIAQWTEHSFGKSCDKGALVVGFDDDGNQVAAIQITDPRTDIRARLSAENEATRWLAVQCDESGDTEDLMVFLHAAGTWGDQIRGPEPLRAPSAPASPLFGPAPEAVDRYRISFDEQQELFRTDNPNYGGLSERLARHWDIRVPEAHWVAEALNWQGYRVALRGMLQNADAATLGHCRKTLNAIASVLPDEPRSVQALVAAAIVNYRAGRIWEAGILRRRALRIMPDQTLPALAAIGDEDDEDAYHHETGLPPLHPW